jgi:4-hydroxy-tetrahydrodipicolinate synthase
MAALTPYYLPCDFAQVHDLFTTVTQAFPEAAVFVYLFPERSGLDVSPDKLGELTAIDGVAGAKLSGRPNVQFERYVELAAAGSQIYSGDDGSYPRVAAAGGAGVVSGVSAAFPEMFGRLTEALMSPSPDRAGVDGAQADVTPAVRAAGPTITRLKYALSTRYGETWGTRMALPAVSAQVRAVIDAAVRAADGQPVGTVRRG